MRSTTVRRCVILSALICPSKACQISADHLLNSISDLLQKTSTDEFLAFLEDPNYSYVSEKIKERQAGSVEFRHPFVLLIYFLAKRFRASLHRKWPLDLDLEPLEGVYSDLGLQPPWTTT